MPEVRLLPAREFPLDEAGRTRFRSRFREVFEGDPSKSPLYKDVSNGIVARRHRVLPAAVLRRDGDARRLPAARRRRRAARRRRGGDRALLAGHRVALPAAARRQGAAAAAADRGVPAGRRVQRRAEGVSRASSLPARRPSAVDLPDDAPPGRCPPVQVDRRADDPLAALKRYLAAAAGARADRRRERRPARDDAAVLRRVRARRCRSSTTGARIAGGDAAPALGSSSPRCTPASPGRRRGSRSSPRPSSTPASCAAAGATPARRSNVDAMLRDLSEVRIGDPVVHEQHGIGRYLGLVTIDLGEGADRVPAARLRQRRQALRAGREPAPHRPLQRRVARSGAAARARQRPVGEGEEARGAAGARHRGRAPQPLRAARRAQGPRVHVQRRTTTRPSPTASASRRRPTSRRRSRR